jgi:hypothetical protein
MVRGLHFYHHSGEVLPERWPTVRVQVYAGETPPPQDLLCFVNLAKSRGTYPGAFEYKFDKFPELKNLQTCTIGRCSCGIGSSFAWLFMIRLAYARPVLPPARHGVHCPVIRLPVRDKSSDADDRVVDVLRKLVANRLADLYVGLTDKIVGGPRTRRGRAQSLGPRR